jgi:hypothetical protein
MVLVGLSSQILCRAVRVFLSQAYPDGVVPPTKQHFLALDENHPLDDWLSQKGVERPRDLSPALNVKYSIRLGNSFYPHMKMLIALMEPAGEPVFGVDTHDRVEVPQGSPDEAGLKELQAKNQELARTIERAWEEHGIPTQASHLKNYLLMFKK